MKDPFLYIVMIGLPGRGKSTVAFKLHESSKSDRIPPDFDFLARFGVECSSGLVRQNIFDHIEMTEKKDA